MKKDKRRSPRLLTRILLFITLAALIVNSYGVWQVFGRPLQTSKTRQKEAPQELLDQIERDKEIADSNSISYIPTSDALKRLENESITVTDESSAKKALVLLQDHMKIVDAEEEYQYASHQVIGDTTYYSMQQYYKNLPIDGYKLIMEVNKDGKVKFVNGTYYPIDSFEPDFAISSWEAESKFEEYLNNQNDNGYNFSIENAGQSISIIKDKPTEVYRMYLKGQDEERYAWFIMDGKTGEILSHGDFIQTESMVADKLKGQKKSHKNVTIWREDDHTYTLYDESRHIRVYSTDAEELSYEQMIGTVNDNPITEMTSDNTKKFDKVAVDALVNTQKAYDYYLNRFNKVGIFDDPNKELRVITNIQNVVSGSEVTSFMDNAMSWGDIIVVGRRNSESYALSYQDNTMAHEYTHSIVKNLSNNALITDHHQKSIQFAINEGIADIMAEYAEDYNNAKKENSCDWKNDARNHKKIKGNFLKNAEDFKVCETECQNCTTGCSECAANCHDNENHECQNCSTDCHKGITILSYPAYLMANGGIKKNKAKAIPNTTMEQIWYSIFPHLNGQTDFKEVRRLIERRACEAAYGSGLKSADPSHRNITLTEDQLECILDAFDQTNIKTDYNLVVKDNSKLIVYDKYKQQYDNYHIQVKKMGTETTVYEADIHEDTLDFGNIDAIRPGLYDVHLVDLADTNLTKDITMIVNDDDMVSEYISYSKSGSVDTDFGAKSRNVALVLDTSGSMEGEPISETKKAAIKFVDTVLDANSNTKISLINYDYDSSILVSSSNDAAELKTNIRLLGAYGQTNLHAGLNDAYNDIKDIVSETKMIVVMSDGLPNVGECNGYDDFDTPIIELANTIKGQNILIYAMGFFHNSSDDEKRAGQSLMESIASPGYHYEIENADNVTYVLDDVAQQVGGNEYIYIEIACPVEVTIKRDGEVLCSDEKNLSTRSSFGSMSFVGEGDERKKLLRLDSSKDYEVIIEGTGEGTMNCSISYPNRNGEYIDTRYFDNVPIKSNSYYSMNTKKKSETQLNVDYDGNGSFDYTLNAKFGEHAISQGSRSAKRVWNIFLWLFVFLLIGHATVAIMRYIKNQKCTNCGAKLRPKSKFCSYCGATVVKQPLITFGIIGYPKEKIASKILKYTWITVMIIIMFISLGIQNSRAFTGYRLLTDRQYESVELFNVK